MDADGSSSGGVSSTSATDQQGPRADPELPQQTDGVYVIAFTRNLAPIAPSRVRMQLGRNDMEPTVIFLESRDGDGDADAGAHDDAHGGLFGFGFGAVPASGVAMACLPETTVGEAKERGECAVCLEEYEAGDALRTMPCAHGFHERCIFGWLRLSRLCPLCRFALPPEEGHGG
ncbi:E3 ubiquitin-protein ligase znrf2 [Sorghum bicolor]|nr:E3 ubiquitin-protein ligase znrf2 [Sorghum bicolor]|eukprot:XP_002448964.1 E3 ubiquitin-protein ligase znrf2 [Sorghum bicolor]